MTKNYELFPRGNFNPTSEITGIPEQNLTKGNFLTEGEIKKGWQIFKLEKVQPVSEENLFKASLYAILSASENFKKQQRVYQDFLNQNLDTPQKILENPECLRGILAVIRFPNNKIRYIENLASWWLTTDLPQRIIRDVNHNGRRDEFALRNELATAKKGSGISYKVASLIMSKSGYMNVVPLDIHMLRFLKAIGFREVKVPDYKIQSGLSDKEYLRYEQIFIEIAQEQSLPPIILQAALWGRFSEWNEENKNQIGFW
jgi:thermostable 8-oxoguanine DNA glycosylase